MTIKELKTGLFGYQKVGVCQYITELEEQFAAKLAEKEEEARRAAEEYQKRIRALEEELQEARRDSDAQRADQLVIAGTLLEAQRYAGQLRQEAEQAKQEAQDRLAEAVAQKERQLARYRGRIEELRVSLRTALEESIDEAQESGPDQNLSLFRRRLEPMA